MDAPLTKLLMKMQLDLLTMLEFVNKMDLSQLLSHKSFLTVLTQQKIVKKSLKEFSVLSSESSTSIMSFLKDVSLNLTWSHMDHNIPRKKKTTLKNKQSGQSELFPEQLHQLSVASRYLCFHVVFVRRSDLRRSLNASQLHEPSF